MTQLQKLKYLNKTSYLPNKDILPINIIDIDRTFYKQNTLLVKTEVLMETFGSKLQQWKWLFYFYSDTTVRHESRSCGFQPV